MNQRIPLSDESLKKILPYLEANLRLHLVEKCPSIKAIDQSVSLRIDNLEFSQCKVIINKTEYIFGVYRDYPEGSTIPNCVKEENAIGGIPYDVDKYGFDLLSNGRYNHFHGDIIFDYHDPHHEPSLKTVKTRLKELKFLLKTTSEGDYRKHSEEQKEKMEIWKTCYDERRREGTLPYKFLFQFIRKTPKTTHAELGDYNKMKIYEAYRTLTFKFFEKRELPTIVKRFRVHEYTALIRLPYSVKFVFHGIETNGNPMETFRKLNRIMHGSSYPLEYLELRNVDVAEFSNKLLSQISAKTEKLIISEYVTNFIPIEKLSLLRSKVVVKAANEKYSGDNFVKLIKQWLVDKAPVGTVSIFEMHNADMTKMIDTIAIGKDLNEDGDYEENGDFVVYTNDKRCIKVRKDECALIFEVIELS